MLLRDGDEETSLLQTPPSYDTPSSPLPSIPVPSIPLQSTPLLSSPLSQFPLMTSSISGMAQLSPPLHLLPSSPPPSSMPSSSPSSPSLPSPSLPSSSRYHLLRHLLRCPSLRWCRLYCPRLSWPPCLGWFHRLQRRWLRCRQRLCRSSPRFLLRHRCPQSYHHTRNKSSVVNVGITATI
jgi:hypothetical protein